MDLDFHTYRIIKNYSVTEINLCHELYTKDKPVLPYLCFIRLAVIYGTGHLSNPLRISEWNQEEILLYRVTQCISNFRF